MARQVYRQVMVVAIVAFIPVVLAAGLVAGYFLGTFLEIQFKLPAVVFILAMVLGVAASVVEVVKLIRLAIRSEKDPQT